MLKRIILTGFLILCTLATVAQGLSIGIKSCPTKACPGVPVIIETEVKNISGQPIKLAYGYHGFLILIAASRADGTPVKHLCGPDVSIKPAAGYRIETKPASWREKIIRSLCLPSEPGEYNVQVVVSSSGPYLQAGGKQIEAWSGEIKSAKVKIQVLDPAGVDKEAYNFFKGSPLAHPEELMKRFPTSTYTGNLLIHRAPSEARWSLNCLNDPDGELHRWGDRGGGEENTQAHIKRAQEKMRSYAKIAGPFLESRPGFFYAPLIRRIYAMCLGLTGNLPEAMNQISILAKGQGKEADEAKAYLKQRASAKARN